MQSHSVTKYQVWCSAGVANTCPCTAMFPLPTNHEDLTNSSWYSAFGTNCSLEHMGQTQIPIQGGHEQFVIPLERSINW